MNSEEAQTVLNILTKEANRQLRKDMYTSTYLRINFESGEQIVFSWFRDESEKIIKKIERSGGTR